MAATVYAAIAAAAGLFLAGIFVERKIIRGRTAERCRACPSDMCLVAYANRRRHDGDTTP